MVASLGAEEVCDAVGNCREEESLLQAMSKGEVQAGDTPTDSIAKTFCPDFFEAKDISYASLGVQQAEEVSAKYCLSAGISREYCEEVAEAVFRPGGEGRQELTNDICIDLLAHSARDMDMVPESPAALLARQSSSGRDDGSHVDGSSVSKGGPACNSRTRTFHQCRRRFVQSMINSQWTCCID